MERIPVIDIFRGLAIWITLAIHLGPIYITQPYGPYPVNYAWYKLWCSGGFGVSIFFVVSGYLITRLIASRPGGLLRPDLGEFYTRRAGRILPLITAVCLFGALLLQFLPFPPDKRVDYCFHNKAAVMDPAFWASIAGFVFNWHKTALGDSNPYFGLHWDVLWSLSIEEQFYILYPLVLLGIRTRRNLAILGVGLVLLMPLSSWYTYKGHPYPSWNSLHYFGLMAFGILLFLAEQRFKDLLKARPNLCWALCAIGAALLWHFFFHSSAKVYIWHHRLGNTFVGLGTFLFLLGGLHLEAFRSKLWRPFTFMGELSYGMYLFHATTLFFLWPFLSTLRHFEAFLVYCLVTALLAKVSYDHFERPLNLRIRRALLGKPGPIVEGDGTPTR